MSKTKNPDNDLLRVGRFQLPAESVRDARRLGNRLRRVLLDEIPGMAATAVRIEGALHEFQAIPGVREDALELIWNLGNVRLIAAEDRVTGTLDSTAPEVTASDLELTGGRVADPGVVLAHPAPGTRLRLKVVFERGTGHRAAGNAPEGFIPLDAWFCPVEHVSAMPEEDGLVLAVTTDGSVHAEAALAEAMRICGDVRDCETLVPEPPRKAPKVKLGPEFFGDPFDGVEPPPATDAVRESYSDFLDNGIPRLLGMLFPLVSRSIAEQETDAGGRPVGRERRLDLISHRIEPPSRSPRQCLDEGTSYEGRLVLRVRVRRSERDDVFSVHDPRALAEQEVDMGPIPLMTEDGSFAIHGCRRVCVMIDDGKFNVLRVGDLLMRELSDLVTRMKPILQDRMDLTDYLKPDMLALLPLSATVTELLNSSVWSQYADETNPLALLVHKTRTMCENIDRSVVDYERQIVTPRHFGRVGYIETPEGPNVGRIQSLGLYARVTPGGEVLTPYRKVIGGNAAGEPTYLSADEEAELKIADPSAVGPDGSLDGENVLVRDGDDIRRVSAGEVDLAPVSPIQALSMSSALIPFLGHDEYTHALMGSNMQRQAVSLVRPEQPLVKSGLEARAARDSGQLVIARRGGKVVEVTGERIVLLAGADRDTYDLTRFRRTNQATCINTLPIVQPGDTVTAGQVLADTAGTCGGELALGRNVLVAYMPFHGYNFEDAICISDELLRGETFTSVHLEDYETETGGAEVDIVSLGTRVERGDVLVQEASGRRRALLITPRYNPAVVVRCKQRNGRVKVTLAELRRTSIGDKFAGRHGNKGCIARVLPRSEMPYMEDGTPVQMILNPLGVVSRLNLGQILETHCGALAHALGTQFIVPPFMEPSIELLQAKLAEAGLSEDGMVSLFDGATGRPFESRVTVGYLYMMKLAHMVDDKIHAISTGAPSLLTHQPVYGGQRLGSFEMWALEANKAGCTLQESLTVKSDDAEGRERAALAMLAGEEVEPAGEGQSLGLLENALRGVGIRVEEER